MAAENSPVKELQLALICFNPLRGTWPRRIPRFSPPSRTILVSIRSAAHGRGESVGTVPVDHVVVFQSAPRHMAAENVLAITPVLPCTLWAVSANIASSKVPACGIRVALTRKYVLFKELCSPAISSGWSGRSKFAEPIILSLAAKLNASPYIRRPMVQPNLWAACNRRAQSAPAPWHPESKIAANPVYRRFRPRADSAA